MSHAMQMQAQRGVNMHTLFYLVSIFLYDNYGLRWQHQKLADNSEF